MSAAADRKQAAYVLPLSLIDRVKHEAVDLRCCPAEVVRSVLERYFVSKDRVGDDRPLSLTA